MKSSKLTNGNTYQFFLNLPFGETMAEQTSISYYQTEFKFNGKELDSETGMYYYGARYYDPSLSIWMSVDPLAEKNHFESPYTYVHNNPMNYIDPDGRDGVRVIDKKNKTITIRAAYFMQTSDRTTSTGTVKGYTAKQIGKIQERTNKFLNGQNMTISEGEYEGYTVQFDLSFEEGGSPLETIISASNENYEGEDVGNSIQRGNETSDPTLFSVTENEDDTTSQTGGVTSGNKNILMNTKADTKKN